MGPSHPGDCRIAALLGSAVGVGNSRFASGWRRADGGTAERVMRTGLAREFGFLAAAN
jgi:hypothetical protein